MVHLIIKRPGQPEQREAVPEGEVTIGRAEGNTIVIDDSRISREHAILTPDASGHRIRDLGSRNGTRVNGKQPTAEGRLLRNGDHIALGRSQVLLSYYTEDVTHTRWLSRSPSTPPSKEEPTSKRTRIRKGRSPGSRG